MRHRKRKNGYIGILLIFLLLFSACSKGALPSATEPSQETASSVTVSVTNLVDAESQKLLKILFEKCGVAPARQEMFFASLQRYHERIGTDKLLSGWTELNATESRFDAYELQDLWAKGGNDFSDLNCRLTAFSLMADCITVQNTADPDCRNIFMDLQAASENSTVFPAIGDLEKFEGLFSTVTGDNSTDQETQAALVRQAWQNRGISVKESKLSLVTLYMHTHFDDTDNEIYVGHTGVLLDGGADGLYFLEKLAFQSPYRLIRLDSRQQLKDYLLQRYQSLQGPDDAEAFVMENGNLM